MSELFIDWGAYHHTVEQLAVNIYQAGWEFDQILCLAKGGLRVGDILSRLFERPLAILSASSYSGDGNQLRGKLIFAPHLTMTTPVLGRRVLIVDDLVDSGYTLRDAPAWLKLHHGEEMQDYRTAVLWYKASSIVKPDYYVHYLPDNPWIHQPFERYERMSMAELAERLENA